LAFVFIPGAGLRACYCYLVAPKLLALSHGAVMTPAMTCRSQSAAWVRVRQPGVEPGEVGSIATLQTFHRSVSPILG
jgi:hypothetical protein